MLLIGAVPVEQVRRTVLRRHASVSKLHRLPFSVRRTNSDVTRLFFSIEKAPD